MSWGVVYDSLLNEPYVIEYTDNQLKLVAESDKRLKEYREYCCGNFVYDIVYEKTKTLKGFNFLRHKRSFHHLVNPMFESALISFITKNVIDKPTLYYYCMIPEEIHKLGEGVECIVRYHSTRKKFDIFVVRDQQSPRHILEIKDGTRSRIKDSTIHDYFKLSSFLIDFEPTFEDNIKFITRTGMSIIFASKQGSRIHTSYNKFSSIS
jgi:hypothetical protein